MSTRSSTQVTARDPLRGRHLLIRARFQTETTHRAAKGVIQRRVAPPRLAMGRRRGGRINPVLLALGDLGKRGIQPRMFKSARSWVDHSYMHIEAGPVAAPEDTDRHICCTVTNVVLGLIRTAGGEAAVAALLEHAATTRKASYLEDIDNWISLDEACALLAAGVHETGDPTFARQVGEQTLQRHVGTQIATLLRSLGSPEAVLHAVAQAAPKFSAVTEMEAIEASPGHAVVRATAREGFTRRPLMCDWTAGMLANAPILFGLPLARRGERMPGARGLPVLVHGLLGRRAGRGGGRSPAARHRT